MSVSNILIVVVLALSATLPLLALHWFEICEVIFRDVAKEAGIHPLIISGEKKKNYVLEVNGSGACWFDYNNDGYMDLYLVNGSTLEQLQHKSRTPPEEHNHLYRNNGNGTFTDVTESAGAAGSGWGFGCAAADYDNDGRTDLLVTTFGPNILYHNNGDGTFTDVSARSGLAGADIWHTGAAFADYDGDGWLDVYIAGYLDFNILHPELKTCDYRGVQVHACGYRSPHNLTLSGALCVCDRAPQATRAPQAPTSQLPGWQAASCCRTSASGDAPKPT
jgi:enediyne biosynthesis protein E4